MKFVRSLFLGIILFWFGFFTDKNYAIFAFGFYLLSFDILINLFRGKKWNYTGNGEVYHWEKFKHDIIGQVLPYVLWNLVLMSLIFVSLREVL